MAKRKNSTRRQRQRPPRNSSAVSKSDYFLQPGKRGAVVVLRKPCGNRAAPKVCGTMPGRAQAKMLIQQLERAESVVNDLFLEATDDGIEALEAVLAACREAVLRRTGGTDQGNGRHPESEAAVDSADAIDEGPPDGEASDN